MTPYTPMQNFCSGNAIIFRCVLFKPPQRWFRVARTRTVRNRRPILFFVRKKYALSSRLNQPYCITLAFPGYFLTREYIPVSKGLKRSQKVQLIHLYFYKFDHFLLFVNQTDCNLKTIRIRFHPISLPRLKFH